MRNNTPADQDRIASIVCRILSLKQRGEPTEDLELAIDRIVCDLYGLTADERRLIGLVDIE